jgi:hypothetical protein
MSSVKFMNVVQTKILRFSRCGVAGMVGLGCWLFAPRASAHIGILGADTKPEIRIMAELTAEGRKLPEPSVERPAIYFPVFAEPKIVMRRDVPERSVVLQWLKPALSASGYECVNPRDDQPSQLLVIDWGEVEPQVEDGIFWNQVEMQEFVVGSKPPLVPWWEHVRLRGEAAEAARYFVRLDAFDYTAAKQGKRVLLWKARISMPVNGVTMAGVMPTLIKLGAPHFGRELSKPIVAFVPLERSPQVELGEAKIMEYLNAEPPSKTPSSGAK